MQALDALDPATVLIEGPSEADPLIRFASEPGMIPPIALLLHTADDAQAALFYPFAEFSPEWQAMRWALARNRPVRFIDWPAAVSLAIKKEPEEPRPDALDLLAEAAGFDDGEAFWNSLIEQKENDGQQALAIFAAIEIAMTEARAQELLATREPTRDLRREAWMRTHIRQTLKETTGKIAVVCGAWHLSALRAPIKPADDKALIQATLKDLPRLKIEATWVPWTDSRLSAGSGYGAGVLSPGWYRHLWSLYGRAHPPVAEEFAAVWQSRTAQTLRHEGYAASTASAIEAARLSLNLAAMRSLPMPGLAEMRDAALATFCHGNPVPLQLIEQKLYIGERVGEIDDRVPQMPLARDLALWQRRTRLKPEDLELEIRLDLRSEAGLLKSTLLHRLLLINVPWGRLVDANSGRGTFREVWILRWQPELSVALAEALIHGVTIEQAAANSAQARARSTPSVPLLAELVQQALVADLPDAATAILSLLQTAAVTATDTTDLMQAVAPLVRALRYGSARKLPEAALRDLIHSLGVEINANVRIGSRALDADATTARVQAIETYDEALGLFADETLTNIWRKELALILDDDLVVPPVAGLSLRRLHDLRTWPLERVATAFSRHTTGRTPQHAGQFLEAFLRGGSEVLMQDEPLLALLDTWLCALPEDDFLESLPLLRRSLGAFDPIAQRRLLDILKRGTRPNAPTLEAAAVNPAFEVALPLLFQILGMEAPKL